MTERIAGEAVAHPMIVGASEIYARIVVATRVKLLLVVALLCRKSTMYNICCENCNLQKQKKIAPQSKFTKESSLHHTSIWYACVRATYAFNSLPSPLQTAVKRLLSMGILTTPTSRLQNLLATCMLCS